jgi:hypothetical protein
MNNNRKITIVILCLTLCALVGGYIYISINANSQEAKKDTAVEYSINRMKAK